MFSIRITLSLVCFVILCNLSVYESRKVSGGGRRTTWSRPSSTSIAKPKPQPTFSHSDVTKLSYGHNEPAAARRPASPPKNTHANTDSHKPSAPPAEHAHNTYQQSAPRPNTNTNPNNPNPNNIGWNVPQNNPGGTGTHNIGWNTNNQQQTQQRVNTANAPPPYPGAPHPQGPPPPYPGNPSYGQNLGAPPAYPGYPSHGAPPAYPGYPSHGQNAGPPPPYPGLNTGYHGTNYNPNQARYPQQPGYGGVGGNQGYPQQYPGGYGGAPGGYGGYGGAPGGYGGYGGGGFGGLGGFGGGGGIGGGGYGGYGGYGNGMFAPKKSGISGTTLVGGALLGLTLYSLARDRNHYHTYYPNSQPVYQNGQPGNAQGPGQGNVQGTANMPNGEHSFNGDQGAYTSYIGNLSCISIYNAREVSLWANNTLQEFYRQYPTQAFPVSVNGSNQSMNFTIVPGEIIHNESLAITCCGTDKPMDVLMITNGKSRDVNCIFETYTMPFRRLTFIPINNTANISANATNSTPIAAPLTSTAIAGNTSTTMAGITSTTMAGITSTTVAGSTTIIAGTNATTTTATATTQEVVAETITPSTITTTAAGEATVQNLTTSSVNVTEVPTTIPSVELTTIKN